MNKEKIELKNVPVFSPCNLLSCIDVHNKEY